jgi:alanine racemase
MVDVTHVDGVALGDEITLIGQQGEQRITAIELAGWGDTIPWEVVCAISKRVPRVYVNENPR